VHENPRRFKEHGKFFSLRHAWTPVNPTRCRCGGRVAVTGNMKRELTLWAGIVAAVLLLVSVGAFLLYVPVMAITIIVAILLGLILMFALGFQAGGRRISISRRKAPPFRLANWSSQG